MKRWVTVPVLVAWLSGACWAGAVAVFPRRNAIVAAVEKAGPGVVNISTEQVMVRQSDPFFRFRDPFHDNSFREYFGRFRRPQRFRTTSLGSGVIIDAEGYVVTNAHVVRRASKIHLRLRDGRTFEGKLLSADADSDLALIKIDADKPLPTVPMGHSDDLMIGETVVALGNPFGLAGTVTVGVLSAKDRSVMLRGQEAYAGLIQTDAAINPGNSGGALVNVHGELIGINLAIHAQAEGIGFAIPVDRVRGVLCGLFNYRLIKKTYIGIKTQDIGPGDLEVHGLRRRQGVLVTAVDAGSPAAESGLGPGDAIVAVDGKAVANTMAFLKAMLGKNVGDRAALGLVRRGKARTAMVAVARVPRPSGLELGRRKLGLTLQPMSQELARSFGLRQPVGLLVSDLVAGGPGDRAGLRPGDILLHFGGVAVNTLNQLAIVLEQVAEASVGLLVVRRGRLYRAVLTTR